MMLRILLLLCFATVTCLVHAQGVVVNPDGTHTVVHWPVDPNATTVIINPDGTHTIVFPGTIPAMVNPNATHSTLLGFDKPNSTGIILYWCGEHSVVHRNGGHAKVINAKGTHTVITNPLWQHLPNANSLVQVASLHCKVAMIWMAGLIW